MMRDLFESPQEKSSDSYSVSELNEFIRNVIQSGIPQPVWVCGEIQGYDRQKTKSHIFFQLIEKEPDTKATRAVIDVVIWAGKKPMIQQILAKSEMAFELKDDIEVKFLCSVDFYPPHGRIRLAIETIDPFYTIGKLAQEKQKLIAQLKKDGVLDRNKLIEVPLVPLTIGLITSGDSAAYNDFVSELRHSGFGFNVLLRNTLMQGKGTEKDVVKALNELTRKKVDIIVITRGGGSISDLSCFDSEAIAKAVAACPLPVFSGIGHEIDLTITDLAAHTYAKTPTAIAQHIVGKVASVVERLDGYQTELLELVDRIFKEKPQLLRNAAITLQNATRHLFKDHHQKMVRYTELLKWKPKAVTKSGLENIVLKKREILKVLEGVFERQRQQLKGYQKMVDIASPVNTMKRGFSITRSADGKILRSKKQIKKNMKVVTEVVDGTFTSEVDEQEDVKSG